MSPSACFEASVAALNWDEEKLSVYGKNAADVKRALTAKRLTIEDFKALISPAAEPFVKEMAIRSYQLTRQRFGNGINFFVPLYLSNACANECLYCGFSVHNPIKRLILKEEQVEQEMRVLKKRKFDHILLVTGETEKVSMPYFERMLPLIRKQFSHISMEIQPLETSQYRRLRQMGLDAVLVYQETYHPGSYAKYHTRGKKRDYGYRLDTPDRAGRAGVHKIGLGVLLGLDDWRTDSVYLAHHLGHLKRHYWRSRFSVSFPRIRPCVGGIKPQSLLSDKQFMQLVSAWRLFDADLELTLSTRESADFRNRIIALGFTSMSAGSSTQPGGYVEAAAALKQFEISDTRSVEAMAGVVSQLGLEVIWKDWEPVLATSV